MNFYLILLSFFLYKFFNVAILFFRILVDLMKDVVFVCCLFCSRRWRIFWMYDVKRLLIFWSFFFFLSAIICMLKVSIRVVVMFRYFVIYFVGVVIEFAYRFCIVIFVVISIRVFWVYSSIRIFYDWSYLSFVDRVCYVCISIFRS